MLTIDIPGYACLNLENLVLDYNGTLAQDGILLPGVADALNALAEQLKIHVITADTFGSSSQQLEGLPCQRIVIPTESQDLDKLKYVLALGPETVVAVGNGRNDWLMLKEAALGIAVIQQEGAARMTLDAATVVSTDIVAALSLFLKPQRLVATLRN